MDHRLHCSHLKAIRHPTDFVFWPVPLSGTLQKHLRVQYMCENIFTYTENRCFVCRTLLYSPWILMSVCTKNSVTPNLLVAFCSSWQGFLSLWWFNEQGRSWAERTQRKVERERVISVRPLQLCLLHSFPWKPQSHSGRRVHALQRDL